MKQNYCLRLLKYFLSSFKLHICIVNFQNFIEETSVEPLNKLTKVSHAAPSSVDIFNIKYATRSDKN